MAYVGQGPAVELLYNLPPEHGLPTLMGNWVEERALDALTGVPRHQVLEAAEAAAMVECCLHKSGR